MHYILIFTLSAVLNGTTLSQTHVSDKVFDNINLCHTAVKMVLAGSDKDVHIDNAFCVEIK